MSVEDTESTREDGPAGSLAEELSRAFDEVAERDSGAGDEGAAAGKSGRARNPDGTFAKGEAADTAADTDAAESGVEAAETGAAAASTGKDKGNDTTEGAEAAAAAAQGLQPPDNWSAADKQRLKELEKTSPDHARWLLDRHKAMEADYTKKTMAFADFRKEYEPIDKLFAPWKERMAAAGYRPSTLVQAWASVEQELMSGDVKRQLGVVERMVRQYKIDPKAVASALGIAGAAAAPAGVKAAGAEPKLGADGKPLDPAAAGAPPEIPAAMAPWVQELAGLRDWKKQMETEQQQERQQRQQETLSRINTEIETFKSAVDKDGKTLLHPHFDEVEQDMSLIAQVARARGEKLSLDQLYDRAVHANPSTRAKQLAAAQAAQRAQSEAEARAKAAAARKAGASVTGAPSAGQTPKDTPKGESLRSQLEAAYDEHSE